MAKKGSAKSEGKFGGVFSLTQLRAAFDFAAPERLRYALHSVCICREGMVSTDGSILLLQTPMAKAETTKSGAVLTDGHLIESAPAEVTMENDEFLMARKDLDELMFLMRSRSRAVKFFASFEDYKVTPPADPNDDPKETMKIVVWAKDGNKAPKIHLERTVERLPGVFPDWRQVAVVEDSYYEIDLDLERIKALLKAAESLHVHKSGSYARFVFPKDASGAFGVWLGDGAEAVAMPCDMDGKNPKFEHITIKGR